MSLVTEGSPVTAIPELDFYTKSPVQTSIESTYTEEVRPVAPLNTGGHIEFIVNSGINEYVKLKETTLYAKFRVRLSKTTGETPNFASDWVNVNVVNNLLHSLWSQIDLQIGDNQTTSSLQTYPFRAYFETILGSTNNSRKTHLQSSMFYEDDMNRLNKDEPRDVPNELIIPANLETDYSRGKLCEIEGKLHLDMFLQHRILLGGTRLKLRLVPNRPEFYFMTSDNTLIPRIEFEDLHLNITKCRVSEDVLVAQNQALSVAPVKYILTRSEVRTASIDSGVTSRNIENVINGQLPRRVYIAFTSNDAYGGNFKKNPYYFDHYNINSIAAYVNGEQFPRKAYTPDFENNLYIREFTELFRVSEQLDNDSRMMIDRKKFKNG